MPAGTLYIVATPIGNLADFSPRGQQVLSEVSRIAAEDTRHSRHLLDHFGINTPMLALHEHNEQQAGAQVIRQLLQGGDVALISDAGTPLLSDPGQRLVQAAHAEKITVLAVPGPSALAAALSAAGFSADSFVFEGFLPPKQQARRKRLESLREETRTLVFYEAPHRIEACLKDLSEIFGEEREAALCKELSKLHERVERDTLAGLQTWLAANGQRSRGEFVLVCAGAAPRQTVCGGEALRILRILSKELPLKQAASLAAQISGEAKNQLYQAGLNDSAK